MIDSIDGELLSGVPIELYGTRTSASPEHAFCELAVDVGLGRSADLLKRVRAAASDLHA